MSSEILKCYLIQLYLLKFITNVFKEASVKTCNPLPDMFLVKLTNYSEELF